MSDKRITASIVGGAGFAGGELARLLLFHPNVEIKQTTSERLAGKFVHKTHPNLRGQTKLKFSSRDEIEPCDVLFLCLPHGESSKEIDYFMGKAERIVDLSADFRLNDEEEYTRHYGAPHPRPEFLERFVYGVPELHREETRDAKLVSSAGCNATATILGLYPLFREGLIETDRTVAEAKVGSSEGGATPNDHSHHPIRSGSVRSYAPAGHRHVAEMKQELGGDNFALHFSATSLDMIRGALVTAHAFLKEPLDEKDVWKLYRKYYGDEPFVRIVKERDGAYRLPEPKLLAGTNFCDVGFQRAPDSNRLVVVSAIDNLMKGAAGQAVQAFNLMHGLPETSGLEFPGLHPV